MDKQELIEKIRSRSTIKDPTTAGFADSGGKAAAIVHKKIEKYFNQGSALSVLDFGAGSGRVAIPFARLSKMERFCCVDVDREAIEYLAVELGESCEASVNSYMPPLQFASNSFDFIYAISVWSHMPEDLSMAWLMEMRRIVKPKGIVFITVAGAGVLDHWKKQLPGQWNNVTIDQLNSQKFIFIEYQYIHSNAKTYPGISGSGSWGNTLIHKDYLNSRWSELFDILEFEPSGMNGLQDIVVLRPRA